MTGKTGVLSVNGWRWYTSDRTLDLRHGKPSDVAEDIAMRQGVEDVSSFLAPDLRGWLPEKGAIIDIRAVATVLADAIEGGEHLGLLGDYDVDGATSIAILVRYLQRHGVAVSWHVPDRVEEGYGPNRAALRQLVSNGANILGILDSGTTARDIIDPVIEESEVEGFVVDHHKPSGPLPETHVVNPNRDDDESGLGHLCTAGLVFLLIREVDQVLADRGIDKKPEYADLLGLTALGTVADVMPLTGLNRAIVANGMEALASNTGVAAIMEEKGVSGPLETHHLGFKIGPCINAGGRIGDASLGTSLLLTDDVDEARRTANRLSRLNDERKSIQDRAVTEAMKIAGTGACGENALVIQDPTLHPGIIGLVAARVRERFDKPTVVIGQGGKGSGRSVDGFDIGKTVISAQHDGLLLKAGGHPAAAGMTVDPAKVGQFRAFLDAHAEGLEPPEYNVDLVVTPDTVDVELVARLQALKPFGVGNPEPRVAVIANGYNGLRRMKEIHFKVRALGARRAVEIKAFNVAGRALENAFLATERERVVFIGKLRNDDFTGEPRVTLQAEDAIQPGA